MIRILTVIQNGVVIGPSDAFGLGNRNGVTIDMHILSFHACLSLRTPDLGPTCHQHLRWSGGDFRVAGRFRVAVVGTYTRGFINFDAHILGMTDSLEMGKKLASKVPWEFLAYYFLPENKVNEWSCKSFL